MSTYRILFLGDIVGRPGRTGVEKTLPFLKDKFKPEFVIVNGENSAAGLGITPDIADQLYKWGVDAITLGNHSFNKREIIPYLESKRPIIRPANMPKSVPGRGLCILEKGGIKLAIINMCGRIYMDSYGDPFELIDEMLEDLDTQHIFVDFHAEATSEKMAMGFYLDGRATCMVGTHTHTPTADAQVLPNGTGYISDVGMCGPYPSVLGMNKEIILRKFTTTLPTRFEVADEPSVICGVVLDVLKDTGRVSQIQQIIKAPWRKDSWS